LLTLGFAFIDENRVTDYAPLWLGLRAGNGLCLDSWLAGHHQGTLDMRKDWDAEAEMFDVKRLFSAGSPCQEVADHEGAKMPTATSRRLSHPVPADTARRSSRPGLLTAAVVAGVLASTAWLLRQQQP
jgi:hypothetical protein